MTNFIYRLPHKRRRLQRTVVSPRTTAGRFQRLQPQSWRPAFRPFFLIDRSNTDFMVRAKRLGCGLDPCTGNDLRWARRRDWVSRLPAVR